MVKVAVMSEEMSEALAVYKDVITQTAQVFGAYASEKVMARAVKAGERLALASIERSKNHAETSDDSHCDDCRCAECGMGGRSDSGMGTEPGYPVADSEKPEVGTDG